MPRQPTKKKRPAVRPGEIIRGLAHDLLNPLSSMGGFLNVLLDPSAQDALAPRQRRILGTMERACALVAGLLNDVSDLSLLESGEASLEDGPVDLRAAARRALMGYEALTFQNRRVPVLEAPESLPAVQGDGGLMERFFDALLRTAARLTSEEGRIVLKMDPVPAGRAPEAVQGVLEHDGESLSAAEWEDLMSGSLSAPRPPEGYAVLGAALCRRIAALHGGSLEVRPRPEGGNRFLFRFPLRRRP